MIRLASRSPQETRAIGEALARTCVSGDVVAVSGALGAGKTVLAQGFALGLGVTGVVSSPSFVLVHSMPGRLTLHHADLWRLERIEEVGELALAELVEDGGVALLEWGERAGPLLEGPSLAVRVSPEREAPVAGGAGAEARALSTGPDLSPEPALLLEADTAPRAIEVSWSGASWQRRAERLEAAVSGFRRGDRR